MIVRLAALTLIAFFSAAARGQTITDTQRGGNCFDLAVIAGAPHELVIRDSSDPNDLIGHPTWQLDIPVESVVLGNDRRKRIRAFVVKHTRYNPAIKRWLFLLKSRPDGNYDEVAADYRVITDDNGHLIIPFSEPVSNGWLFPDGPVPPSYQSLLKPVKYPSSRTWWLQEYDDVEPELLDPAWAYRKGKHVVARRGIYLADWAGAMKQEPGAICPTH